MKRQALLLCALAIVLTGCQLSQARQASQVQDVMGVWWQLDHPHYDPAYLILREEGTYTIASNPEGENGVSGEFWFEGAHFFIRDDFCSIPGEYEVSLKEEDGKPLSLAFSLVEDECSARVGILTSREATWFGPAP